MPRASQDPRFTIGSPYPPADVVILHLYTGRLDIVPGLELPPLTRAGLVATSLNGTRSRPAKLPPNAGPTRSPYPITPTWK